MFRAIFKTLKWAVISLLVAVVLLLLPVAYVETFCRDEADGSNYQAIIQTPDFLRKEANSYLTYPEWHIVYAYEGLANVLKTGDEHEFGYLKSIGGFWSSFCALNKIANRHGGGSFNTRATVHTIVVSFTLEMVMKALYEETIGRVFALFRGQQKTPQDLYSAKMAEDYATFLQQVPWYKYDFDKARKELWAMPITSTLRGWERRLGLGGEWWAKAGYAQVIAQAVEAAGQAPLRIRSVISGLDREQLLAIEGVEIIEQSAAHIVIETPRYRQFTKILTQIVAAGGTVKEIAGNDEIMLTATGMSLADDLGNLQVISRINRDGFEGERVLINTKLQDLGVTLKSVGERGMSLEHIYDY